MSPLILSPTGMFLLSPPPLLPLLSFLYSGMRRFEEETCELMDGGRLNWNWRVFIKRWRSEKSMSSSSTLQRYVLVVHSVSQLLTWMSIAVRMTAMKVGSLVLWDS